MASAALATGRVLSRNHCSGADLRRRALFARVDDPHPDRRRPGTRQRHRLVAQRHGGDARRTLLLAGLFAGLHARALPTHLDAAAAARGTATHLLEQAARDLVPVRRALLGKHPVDLRTDQQFHLRRVLAPLHEQVHEVGLAVQGAQHARIRQLLARLCHSRADPRSSETTCAPRALSVPCSAPRQAPPWPRAGGRRRQPAGCPAAPPRG